MVRIKVLLVGILLVTILIGSYLPKSIFGDKDVAESLKNNEVTKASDSIYQEDCPENDSIIISSENEINNDNVNDYLNVESYLGEIPTDFSVEKTSEGLYKITPKQSLTQGCTYDFTVKNGASFVAEDSQTIETITKRVAKPESEVVELNTGIVYLDWDDVNGESAETIKSVSTDKAEDITEGTVLCILNGYNEWKESGSNKEQLTELYDDDMLFVKTESIDSIKYTNQKDVGLSVTDAEPSDVYDNVDISIKEGVSAEELLDLDQIEEEVKNSEGTEDLANLLAAAISQDETYVELNSYASDGGSTSYFRNGVSFENGKSLSLGSKMLQGLTVTATISHDAENANFPNAMEDGWQALELVLSFETQVRAVQIYAEVKVTQYLNISMQGYKKMNGDDLDFDYALNMYSQTNFDVTVLVCSTTPASKITGNVQKTTPSGNTRNWFDITESIEEQLTAENTDADNIVSQMKELLESKGDYIELLNVPIIRKVYRVIPEIPVFGVGLNLNYVLKFNFAAGIKSEMSVLDAVQIGMEGSTKGDNKGVRSYKHELPGANRYSYDLYAAGYLGVKTGFEGQLTLSFLGLNQLGEIGIEVEVGVYLDCYGYFHFSLTKKNQFSDTVDKQFYGGYYVDLGIYLEINLIAQSEVFDVKAEANLLDMKWSLATFGNKYVFYGITDLSDDSEFFMNTNSVKLTDLLNIEGKYLDLTTGETEIKPIDDVLSNINFTFSDVAFSYRDNTISVQPDEVRKYAKVDGFSDYYAYQRVNKTICTVNLKYSGPSLISTVSNGGNGFSKDFRIYWANPSSGIKSMEQFSQTYTVRYQLRFQDGTTKLLDTVEYVEAGKTVNGFKMTKEEQQRYKLKVSSQANAKDYNSVDFKNTPTENTVYTLDAVKRQGYVTFVYYDTEQLKWIASIRVANVGEVPEYPEINNTLFTSWSNGVEPLPNVYYELNGYQVNQEIGNVEINNHYQPDAELQSYVDSIGIVLKPNKQLQEQGISSLSFNNTAVYIANYRDSNLILCSSKGEQTVQKVRFGTNSYASGFVSFDRDMGLMLGWDINDDGVVDFGAGEAFPPAIEETVIARAIYQNETVAADIYTYNADEYDYVKSNEVTLYSNHILNFAKNGNVTLEGGSYQADVNAAFNTLSGGVWQYSYTPSSVDETRVWNTCDGRVKIESRGIAFRYLVGNSTITFTTSSDYPFTLSDDTKAEISSYSVSIPIDDTFTLADGNYFDKFDVARYFESNDGLYLLSGFDTNSDEIVDIGYGSYYVVRDTNQTLKAVYTFSPYTYTTTVTSQTNLYLSDDDFNGLKAENKNGQYVYSLSSDYDSVISFSDYIVNHLPESGIDTETQQQYYYYAFETSSTAHGKEFTSSIYVAKMIDSHTITLNANGGEFYYPTSSETVQLNINSGMIKLGDFTKYANYSPRKNSEGVEWSVDYWVDTAGNHYFATDDIILHEDMTFNAHWVAKTEIRLEVSDYTYGDFDETYETFNDSAVMWLNVGEHNVSEFIKPVQKQDFNYDLKTYSVVAWQDKDSGVIYNVDDTIMITETPITLVAIWDLTAVRVRFLNAAFTGECGNNPYIQGNMNDIAYLMIPPGTYSISDFPKMPHYYMYGERYGIENIGWTKSGESTIYREGDTVEITDATDFVPACVDFYATLAVFDANGGYFENGESQFETALYPRLYQVNSTSSGDEVLEFPIVKNDLYADYEFLGWKVTKYICNKAVSTFVLAPGETYTVSEVGTDEWNDIKATALWRFIGEANHRIGYRYDDEYHWEVCLNDGCGYESESKEQHSFVNGYCTVCNCHKPPERDKNGYYIITDINDLVWFRDAVNSGRNTISAVLAKDITLQYEEWESIGYYTESSILPFKGTIDGQGHTVALLYCSSSGSGGFVGLLGENGVIKNINFNYAYITANVGAGTVCGMNGTDSETGGLIENCCVNNYRVNAELSIGAICGVINSGTVRNCLSVFNTRGSSNPMFGEVCDDAVIENCYYYCDGEEIDEINGTLCVTANDIIFGKAAYLLNQGANGNVWGQDLSGVNEETLPTVGGPSVYRYEGKQCNGEDYEVKFTNDAAIANTKQIEHNYKLLSITKTHPHSAYYKCADCNATKRVNNDYCPDCVECNFVLDSNNNKITKYLGSQSRVVIPNKISNTEITLIDDLTFFDNFSINSIVIEDGIEIIGANAFSECSSLNSIFIPDSVISISPSAFDSCYSTVYCYEGSYAADFCEEYYIDYVFVDISETEDAVIDYDNHLIFTKSKCVYDVLDIICVSSSVTLNVTGTFDDAKLLGTGSDISILKDSSLKGEFKLIVIGDLNGDGVCDVLDAVIAEKVSSRITTDFTDEQCYAANGEYNNDFDVNSYQTVVNNALA